MPLTDFLVIISIVLVALFFDFLNGFHDAANSIATVVSTRVLHPRLAVLWAAFFNFVAAFGFGVAVASTIGRGIVDASIVNEWFILATLIGAIAWDIITWYFGLPTSSSHALIGGLIGAALITAGPVGIVSEGILKVLAFIVVSPLVGLVVGLLLSAITFRIGQKLGNRKANAYFKRFQLVSAALYSLGHGTNDAQKTMGIISVLLFSAGYLGSTFYVPFYVVLMAHAAIALGTYAGGWRIVRTMGMRITKLVPQGGFSAETAAALTLFATAAVGIPVSTTHTIAGAIIGVGSVRRLSAVRWGVARRIIWAWILTIPASAAISALALVAIRGLLRL